ncbi:glycosyl transferase, partial [Streptomyces cavourensis]|nr:glycosyl transferase [Streptomyces cavourensis]
RLDRTESGSSSTVTCAGRLALAVVGLSFAASLAAPAAYTVSTLSTGHQGSIVTAGPSGAGFGMGGPGGGGGRGGPGGGPNGGDGDGRGQRGGAQMQPPGGPGQFPGQGQGQAPGQGQGNQQGNATGGMPAGGMPPVPGEGMRGGGGGGMGGLLNGASVSAEAKALLARDADDYTWAAAAIGAQNAASYQLATEQPVMAIGGFNGSDPSPTLAQFKKYVEEGRIHYFVSGGGMGGGGEGGGGMGGGGMGGSGTAFQISSWVTENFTEVTVGGATFYDLTQPVS